MTVETRSDHELNGGTQRVRVRVLGDDGNVINAFAGRMVALPGYLFADGTIVMHPGRHRLGQFCPRPTGVTEMLDVMPTVEFELRAGRRYDLYCHEGRSALRDSPPLTP